MKRISNFAGNKIGIMQLDQTKIKPKVPTINDMLDQYNSLILATVNEDGTPLASYAPYGNLNGGFQVFVSFMSKHTKNLRDRKMVSVMMIEDESATKQIYARDRLTIECEAVLVEKEDAFYADVIAGLQAKHGKIVEVLAGLNDFVLFDLRPIKGNYVNGFGSAYTVNADLTVNEHVRGAHGQNEDKKN